MSANGEEADMGAVNIEIKKSDGKGKGVAII